MFCPNCGKEIANDSNFCEFCGAKVEVRGTQVIDRATMPINSQVGGAGNATQILDRVKTPVAAAPSPSSPKKEEPKRKKGRLWIVVGIVGILLLGLIVMLSGNEEEPVFDMVENLIDSSYVDQSDEIEPPTIDGQSGASVQADSLMIPASSAKQETKQTAPLLEAESKAKIEAEHQAKIAAEAKRKEKLQADTESKKRPLSALGVDKWVDLGLPSGTQWYGKNEPGPYYTFDEAVAKFGDNLPTFEQLKELRCECKWTWIGNGYKVVGPNGNSIILPAVGTHFCDGGEDYVGTGGDLWSSTPSGASPREAIILSFSSDLVELHGCYRCVGSSVRLVQ